MLQSKQWASSNAADLQLYGRWFEPQSAHFGAAASGDAKSQQTRIRTDACKHGGSCVTIGPLTVLPVPCVPTACSLLSKTFDPPPHPHPHPPLKKVISSFRG